MLSYLNTFGAVDIYLLVLILGGIYAGFADIYSSLKIQKLMLISITLAFFCVF